MRLASGVAPPGRVGEALSSIGIAAQLASLIGNIAVAVLNRWLMSTDLYDPLWIYYPACGTLSLCAIIPLIGTPRGGWGSASGDLQEQRRWRVDGNTASCSRDPEVLPPLVSAVSCAIQVSRRAQPPSCAQISSPLGAGFLHRL
eukprot:s2616_g2.t1